MAGQRNLNDPNLQQQLSQNRRNATASPLGHSSIGREGLRIYDGGVLLIQNGGLDVTGTASISGSLAISGTLTQTGTSTFTGTTRLSGHTDVWGPLTVTGDTDLDGVTTITGPTTVTGTFKVTGPTSLDGELDINGDTTVTGKLTITGDTTASGKLDVTGAMSTKGTLSVEGITTLKNDLDVVSGGRIKVGAMTLDPVAGGGRVEFDNGSVLAGSSTGLTFADGNRSASLSLSQFSVLRGQNSSITVGLGQIQLNATNTLIFGQIQAPHMDTVPGGQKANVYYSPTSGLLYYVP